MSSYDEIQSMLDELVYPIPYTPYTPYTYSTPEMHTPAYAYATPEEILENILNQDSSLPDPAEPDYDTFFDTETPPFDFRKPLSYDSTYELPDHLNKTDSCANAIDIQQKCKVDINPKATTSHILKNIGAYSEEEIMSLINTEVDELEMSGHEPLRRACTIQKTLKVISHVFGLPIKTLYYLCGSESFARCQHELGLSPIGQMRGQVSRGASHFFHTAFGGIAC